MGDRSKSAAGRPMAALEALELPEGGDVPNSPLPVLVYRGVLGGPALSADRFDAMFEANGWRNGWHDGIYDCTHFHTTAHEALGIARGEVRVRLGGEAGRSVELAAGDVVVLPAGVGHRNEGASPDLLVVGAYAEGRDWDMRKPPSDAAAMREALRRVPLPEADPVYGRDGPLLERWRRAAGALA